MPELRTNQEERKEERSDDGLNANNGDPLLPMMNDTNLEERVALIEFQMANVQEDVVDIRRRSVGPG